MVGLLRATWKKLDSVLVSVLVGVLVGVLEEIGREIDSLKSKNFEEILK
jgi:TctA family transporter